MFRNRSVNVHQFAMVPKADVPRSGFRMQKALKTTFDSGFLVPIFVEEVLPGDTFNLHMTAFCRMATPIFPVMDNLHLESFFFFVPNRLVWDNWVKFMGEQTNPGDSTSYVIPTVPLPAGGAFATDMGDYFGLPTQGQMNPGDSADVNALPFRAYNLIYNEWFRDQNLIDSIDVPRGDGPDLYSQYGVRRRNKRHDYFTSCLPFLQKGEAVSVPLGTTAEVVPSGDGMPSFHSSFGTDVFGRLVGGPTTGTNTSWETGPASGTGGFAVWTDPKLEVNLSDATAATINQLRQAFQIQKLLERDARGGTRYTEIVRAHFGVISPDARLQRPEYLGGGYSRININPIAQTAPTSVVSPQGNLAAFATSVIEHGFSSSFTEHGYIIGMVNVRADLTYQQGIRKHWSRQTRYDYYFPAFAMLGEQAVKMREIYATGSDVDDDVVFGYQERWAEYRYLPSEITGLFRSNFLAPLDAWHLAQHFDTPPGLNIDFIEEHPPIQRVVAVGDDAAGQEFLLDGFFDMKAARPLPMYSVPGLIDHF